jgi:hypothetical protein
MLAGLTIGGVAGIIWLYYYGAMLTFLLPNEKTGLSEVRGSNCNSARFWDNVSMLEAERMMFIIKYPVSVMRA